MQNLTNMQQTFMPPPVLNNQLPSTQNTLSNNAHVTYPYGKSFVGQFNISAIDPNSGMNDILPWAANMGTQLKCRT